jgi:hypothetical protein
MNFERNFENEIEAKIEDAKASASPLTKEKAFYKDEAEVHLNFINGEYDIEKFKETLGDLNESSGRVYFDTLPEFILAIRKVIPNKKEQDEILDHENAHALEAQKRGYSFRYAIDFTRDEKKLLVFKLVRTSVISAGVHIDYFNKNGAQPKNEELKEDLIAIIEAPEVLTDGKMGEWDKKALGRERE